MFISELTVITRSQQLANLPKQAATLERFADRKYQEI